MPIDAALVAWDEACARGDADAAVLALHALVTDAFENGHTDGALVLVERFCACGEQFRAAARDYESLPDLLIEYVDAKTHVDPFPERWTGTRADHETVLRDIVAAVSMCTHRTHFPGFSYGLDVLRQASYEFVRSRRMREKLLGDYLSSVASIKAMS